ncbi:MAG: hypothetical protein NC123_08900 [Butyrivibrio sp.]|nr:hypothetical protein [Butyrivibrio sp.]
MARENRNFNGVQINQSVTIVEQAGADIADARNRILAYDEDGNVVLAADGSAVLVGIALIEAGVNDISGVESGKVSAGDDVDIQIKDIGYILAGGDIAKGEEVTAANGLAVKAEAGNYVVGIALSAVSKDEYCRVQIAKYQKN